MNAQGIAMERPEHARRIAVRGPLGYVDRVGVAPGESVRFHLSAPSAYRLDVVRLGRHAIIDAPGDAEADRADVETLASFESATATPQHIEPGSYIHVGGAPLPAGPLSCGLWLRLWRLPVLDELQWAWSSLISDLDYPMAARFALVVDHLGRIGCYVGDGGVFDHERMHWTEPLLGERLGRWVHVAATLGRDELAMFTDGVTVATATPQDGFAPRWARRSRSELSIAHRCFSGTRTGR